MTFLKMYLLSPRVANTKNTLQFLFIFFFISTANRKSTALCTCHVVDGLLGTKKECECVSRNLSTMQVTDMHDRAQ